MVIAASFSMNASGDSEFLEILFNAAAKIGAEAFFLAFIKVITVLNISKRVAGDLNIHGITLRICAVNSSNDMRRASPESSRFSRSASTS